MKKINSIIFTAIVDLSFIFVSCSRENKISTENSVIEILPDDIVELREDQIKLAGIELGSIKIQSIGNTLKVNGIVSVVPQNLATVCMPLGGYIKSIRVLSGDYVTKGEVLAVIENQEFVDIEQNYLEAKNRLSFAKSEYERHNDLYKADVYSEKNVQQVTVEYSNQIVEVKSLEQKLLMIGIDPGKLKDEDISSTVNLLSPISGFVRTVNINIGKFVSSTDVLFEVVNSEKLFLDLTLFEKDAEKPEKGQRVKFFVNNRNDEYEAIIMQTGKSIGDDKTLKVLAAITSPCENILPGMYVNAYIQESGKETATLPSEAIVSFDDKDLIFVFDKDKVEDGKQFTEYRIVEVKRGITSSGFTEIILPAGFDITNSRVVIKGAYTLLSAKKNSGEMAC